jgi:hypothetical protein
MLLKAKIKVLVVHFSYTALAALVLFSVALNLPRPEVATKFMCRGLGQLSNLRFTALLTPHTWTKVSHKARMIWLWPCWYYEGSIS